LNYLIRGENKLNKNEIVDKIAEKLQDKRPNLSKRAIDDVVNTFLDTVTEEVQLGNEVYLQKLGKFYTSYQRWQSDREVRSVSFVRTNMLKRLVGITERIEGINRRVRFRTSETLRRKVKC